MQPEKIPHCEQFILRHEQAALQRCFEIRITMTRKVKYCILAAGLHHIRMPSLLMSELVLSSWLKIRKCGFNFVARITQARSLAGPWFIDAEDGIRCYACSAARPGQHFGARYVGDLSRI